ncbi:MAG: phospho-N-acetylmuramoyl-pentapeptide-transferase [Planctomycetaceae bacterium]|jgi:phospho-N-acetylmuramoyl-pentapeptide-transferase|nr:phospho-N-acetylmuramoyl-pentapeptide-transferase [Planctomycetaceae bacterium]MBT6493483.1 phospho-N-acetylmuramoyl-pentapeptide-transferase [Planctomycetaceae bacterium]
MLFWLLNRFAPLLEQMEFYSSGDSRVFLTARAALASVTSFLMAILFGPPAIAWLKRRFCERIDSASERLNELQASKAKTPTMGGLFVIAAVVVSVLLWGNLSSRYVQMALFVAIGFATLGAIDDWIKLSTERNGLSARVKLLVQTALATCVGVVLYREHLHQPHGLELIWPLGNHGVWLGGGFIAWSVLVTVGSSNAVNLTDGLDGLASGCMVFAGSAFVALTYLAGHAVMADYVNVPFIPGAGELCIVMGALVGAMLGFLWFNCYPAQVFMGDTGSLPIGALLALAALVTRQEVLLVVIGGIFVIETLSVLMQVGWFRMTGNRLIACSPLHNHFLFKGQHEIKIVVRFWIGSALLAIVAVASLKIR